MSDAFDSASSTEEQLNKYIKELSYLHSHILPNTSDDPLDRSLTILSFNEVSTLSRNPNTDKMLGLIEYDSDQNKVSSKYNSYLKYVTLKMIDNEDYVKLFGLSLKDIMSMTFNQFKTILELMEEYRKKKEQITETEEDKLQKEKQKILNMIQSNPLLTQSKK